MPISNDLSVVSAPKSEPYPKRSSSLSTQTHTSFQSALSDASQMKSPQKSLEEPIVLANASPELAEVPLPESADAVVFPESADAGTTLIDTDNHAVVLTLGGSTSIVDSEVVSNLNQSGIIPPQDGVILPLALNEDALLDVGHESLMSESTWVTVSLPPSEEGADPLKILSPEQGASTIAIDIQSTNQTPPAADANKMASSVLPLESSLEGHIDALVSNTSEATLDENVLSGTRLPNETMPSLNAATISQVTAGASVPIPSVIEGQRTTSVPDLAKMSAMLDKLAASQGEQQRFTEKVIDNANAASQENNDTLDWVMNQMKGTVTPFINTKLASSTLNSDATSSGPLSSLSTDEMLLSSSTVELTDSENSRTLLESIRNMAATPITNNTASISPSLNSNTSTALVMTVPPSNPNWLPEMGAKVTWIASQGIQSAEIHLDPPELGSLTVKLSLDGDTASVSFSAATPQARDLLDAQLSRLREMLAQQGVDLGKVDVNVSQQQQGNSREQTKQTANSVNTPDLIESNEDESISTGYVTTKGIDFYA